MKKLILSLSLLALIGCNSYSSLNMHRSALRSAGDTFATSYLDNTQHDEVNDRINNIKSITKNAKEFLKDGNVTQLTKMEISSHVKTLIDNKYHSLIDFLLNNIPDKYNTQAIGKNNQERLIALCNGIINGTIYYDINDRPNQ